MKVCNLSSGSDGNITYVETASAKILIDIGLSCAEVCKRLALLGVEPNQIDAILISHEHSDHIKGLDVFVSKFGTKVYVHTNGISAVFEKMKKAKKNCFYEFADTDFCIKDATISNVTLPHDSVHCTGYIISSNQRKIAIITDLGHTNSVILNKIKGSSLVYIESNHDVEMLKNNPNYPMCLKNRILGKNGHLSNLACAKVVEELAKAGTKQFMLSHLSTHNNTPTLAYTTVCQYLKSVGIIEGINIKISVAMLHPTSMFVLN
ncbi:MAG: MBL fold metallo-hydrolase [Clostridia bacterium]|nr:MBL fold metallo-hydrolase [Clostridia bacterium]